MTDRSGRPVNTSPINYAQKGDSDSSHLLAHVSPFCHVIVIPTPRLITFATPCPLGAPPIRVDETSRYALDAWVSAGYEPGDASR